MRTVFFVSIASIMLINLGCGDDDSGQVGDVPRDDAAQQLAIDLSGSLQNPAFSPDGKAIVFTRFRSGYNEGKADLYMYRLDTKALTPLVSDGSANVNLPGSAWNGATASIVFSSDRAPHDEIYLIAATGTTGDEIRITDRADKQSYEPTLSPDGQWVVFESHDIDVEGHGVITKYKIDGTSGYVDLTDSNDDCRQPNWSASGDKILYQKQDGGHWAIWVMDIDGQNKTMVTPSDENATDAAFSPDGQWIFYSSENDSVELANVYQVAVSGGASTRITQFRGYDGASSISPDSREIVFESTPGDPDTSKGSSLWLMDMSL
ncbi:MAG: PD40 domain-containing protein [Deltaproteobacteria bacterium]|nr:PD40 domain-containing protein [Deltaproteobacteria bacterium]